MTKKQMRVESRFAESTLELSFLPRFNIAPTQLCTVLRLVDGRLVAQGMSWGFRPVWSKGPLVNAKSETLHQKPTFNRAVQCRRCLVPADGFYEWQLNGVRKRAMHIQLAGQAPFCFAGLWDEPTRDAPTAAGSFLILTRAADEVMASIHSRMPAILTAADYDRWLDPDSTDFESVLRSPVQGTLIYREVSSRVNQVRNEDADCLNPPEQSEFSL